MEACCIAMVRRDVGQSFWCSVRRNWERGKDIELLKGFLLVGHRSNTWGLVCYVHSVPMTFEVLLCWR